MPCSMRCLQRTYERPAKILVAPKPLTTWLLVCDHPESMTCPCRPTYRGIYGGRLDGVLGLLDGGHAGEQLVAARQLRALGLQRRHPRRQLLDGPPVVVALLPLLLAVPQLRSPEVQKKGFGDRFHMEGVKPSAGAQSNTDPRRERN